MGHSLESLYMPPVPWKINCLFETICRKTANSESSTFAAPTPNSYLHLRAVDVRSEPTTVKRKKANFSLRNKRTVILKTYNVVFLFHVVFIREQMQYYVQFGALNFKQLAIRSESSREETEWLNVWILLCIYWQKLYSFGRRLCHCHDAYCILDPSG